MPLVAGFHRQSPCEQQAYTDAGLHSSGGGRISIIIITSLGGEEISTILGSIFSY